MTENTDFQQLWPSFPQFVEIPADFHSLHDGPFQLCVVCECSLADTESGYSIERVFRGTEPIIEYAMCSSCQQQYSCEISEESKENIQAFFAALDMNARIEKLRPSLREPDVAPWLANCLVTGRKRSECKAYQIVCQCYGTELMRSVTPFLLSQEAIEQIVGVISKATRERMEDFMGDQFGMPPEFCESPDFFPLPI